MNDLLIKYLLENIKAKQEYDEEFKKIVEDLDPYMKKSKEDRTLADCDFISECTTRLAEIDLLLLFLKEHKEGINEKDR